MIDKFISGNKSLETIFKIFIRKGVNNTKMEVIKANIKFLSLKEIYSIIKITKI